MGRKGFARYWLAAALAISAAPAAEAANFLDEFARAFLGGPRVTASPVHEPEFIEPRRVAPRPRTEVSSRPKPPVVKLDPAADPQWYLKDPTLRRGDIVVTANGVKVYQGRNSDALRNGDFAALGGQPGDKGWKGTLQAAAAGGRTFFHDTPAGPNMASLAQPMEAGLETVQR